MMNDRLRKALVALMAVAAVGACDDPPVDPAQEDAERLQTNPSSVAVNAGDTTFVDAFLVTALGQPLLGEATFETCNATIATVIADESQTDLEPGTRFGIIGQTVGTTCVLVRAGEFEDSVLVRVVAASFQVDNLPDSIRAGTAGDLSVAALNAQGGNVGPFTEADADFESSDEDRLFFTDSTGGFDTEEAGNVDVTISWESQGIVRDTTIAVVVIPAEPDSAALSADDFGAVAAGDSTSLEVLPFDSLGNLNRLPQDLISVTATSDDPSVATASASFVEDPAAPGEVVPTIQVFAEGSGSTTIDITLTTVSGTFTFNDVPVTILDPSVLSITPSSGQPGETAVITGTGLSSPGFDTQVFMGSTDVTMFVDNVTATAITLDMPAALVDGDQEISVAVGGVGSSNSTTWTQTGPEDVHGPENEDLATAPLVLAPGDVAGSFHEGNVQDFYRFTVAAPDTLSFQLNWTGSKDLDFLIANSAFTAVVCPNTGQTAAHPENINNCALAPGTYVISIVDYSQDANGITTTVGYHIRIQ